MIDRREILLGMTSLLAFAQIRGALAKGDIRRLIAEAAALGERRSGIEWQNEIERLLIGADVREIAEAIDLDRVLAAAPPVEKGARVLMIPPVSWLPGRPGGSVKLFAFEPGRANPPHAHDRMVSIHLVLAGRFRVRHFDRVRDEPDHIVVRPTIDREIGPAEGTSISDARDNVHWHRALERGVLLDVLAASRQTTTHLIDPDRAKRDGELLIAPRIASVEEALKRYG